VQRLVEAEAVTDDDVGRRDGGAEVADEAPHERFQGAWVDGGGRDG